MTALGGEPRLLARVDVRALDRWVLTADVDDEGRPQPVDLAILPVFLDERPLLGVAGYLDWRLCGRLSALLRSGFGTGDCDERVLTCGHRNVPFERVVLLGVGQSGRFDREAAQAAAARVVEIGGSLRATSLAVSVPAGMVSRELCESFGLALGQRLAQAEVVTDDVSTSADVPLSGARLPPRVRVYVPEDWVARFLRLLAGPPRPAESID